MKWPKCNAEIKARVDGSLAALTHDQFVTTIS
jgi:hypothetical protein